MDMDTSPLIGVWTADNEFHTIEFTATTFIDRVSGLTCDYTDNGNSITLSNCMGVEGAENRNGATVGYTIDGDTLTLDGTAYTRQNSDVPEPTVPGTMDAPSLEAGNAQLTVNWTPPEKSGGSDITAYELRHSDDGGSSWSEDITTADAPATETIITGLTNGTAYTVQARARNSAGAGEWSESSAEATPITVSLAPTAFTLVADDTTITATWTAPTDTGNSAIIRYELQHHEVGAGEWGNPVSIAVNADPNHTYTHPIPNLTNGTEYEVRVYAVNTEGNGNPATSTATPATVPSAPNAPTLTAGNAQITASWTAPNNGGSPITGYDVQYSSDSGSTWTAAPGNPISGTSYTIPSLTNGTTYDVQVRAVNAVGDGDWSLSATRTLLPLAARVPFGTSTTSVILSADIDDAAANAENPSVTVAGVTSGTSVTPPTVDSSTGVITVTATTTAGTYNVSVIDGTDENTRVTKKFYVTVRPQDEDNKYADDAGSDAAEILADLKLKVNTGISTWGNTADLNYIITTAVTDMDEVFALKYYFNGDISIWDVSSVTIMSGMFSQAYVFNGDISGWVVSSVTNMSNMFDRVTVFNQDLSRWDVSKVTNMDFLFNGAIAFNGDISGWVVSSVISTLGMFNGAIAFNGDISGWNVSKVTNMGSMFYSASAFSQNLEEWKDHWSTAAGTLNAAGQYTGSKADTFLDSGLDANPASNDDSGDQPNYPSWY